MGVFRMKRLVTIAACAALAGCATSPKDIAPSYVSPILYQNLSCDQLSQEALRVSNAAAVATGQQQNQANKDAAMMTVGMILFWPSLFMIGGDKGNAAEVARLKGEMQAIEQANIAKNCGLKFGRG